MSKRRPRSIRWFERLTLCSIVAALLYNYLAWDDVIATVESDGFGPEFVVAFMTLVYGLYLLLLWLIVWRKNNIAKWIWIALSLFGLIAVLVDYRALMVEGGLAVALAATQYLLSIVALPLLFRPDARRWFAGQEEIDPEVFR